MKRIALEEQLKEYMAKSGLSRYQISQISEISEAQLSRFVNGKRSLTIRAAGKIADVLGLELKPIKKKAGEQ